MIKLVLSYILLVAVFAVASAAPAAGAKPCLDLFLLPFLFPTAAATTAAAGK